MYNTAIYIYILYTITDDGRVNPVDATTAFAKAAKQRGVKYYEGISIRSVCRMSECILSTTYYILYTLHHSIYQIHYIYTICTLYTH